MNDPPHHCVADAAVDTVPTGAKDPCGLAPGHASRPRTQKPLVGGRHLLFATGPLQIFGLHTATWTIHSSHCVNEEHRKAKDRDEFKLSRRSCVVDRPLASALTTTRSAVLARSNIDQDAITGDIRIPVNKPLERVPAIEDSLELHLVLTRLVAGIVLSTNTNNRIVCQMHFLFQIE